MVHILKPRHTVRTPLSVLFCTRPQDILREMESRVATAHRYGAGIRVLVAGLLVAMGGSDLSAQGLTLLRPSPCFHLLLALLGNDGACAFLGRRHRASGTMALRLGLRGGSAEGEEHQAQLGRRSPGGLHGGHLAVQQPAASALPDSESERQCSRATDMLQVQSGISHPESAQVSSPPALAAGERVRGVCVCARARACMRACMRVCVCASVCVCVCAFFARVPS